MIMDEYLTEYENTNIAGPNIKARSMRGAQLIADTYNTSFGRLIVIGKLIEEIGLEEECFIMWLN